MRIIQGMGFAIGCLFFLFVVWMNLTAGYFNLSRQYCGCSVRYSNGIELAVAYLCPKGHYCSLSLWEEGLLLLARLDFNR